MKRSRARLWLLIAAFAFLCSSAAIRAQDKPQARDQFPTFQVLTQTNVSLEMKGFVFTAGMRANQQGKPNGAGIERAAAGWSGSGFIVTSDGVLLTNCHVARRAVEARAVFEDGSAYEVRQIMACDPNLDVAVMRIRANRTFPTVNLGDSDSANVMDRVLAVGNALGQHMSVTEGMINQVIRDDNNMVRLFTHSAPIAPGNSGGALYKASTVVGVNFAGSPPYVRGYAIPVNLVRSLLSEVVKYPKPLDQYFPTDLQSILERAEPLQSTSGQVPAADRDSPGRKSFNAQFPPNEDIALMLRSQQGVDLDLAISDSRGDLVGVANSNAPDFEVLFVSSGTLYEGSVHVLNYGNKPSNFGLALCRIKW